MTESYFDSLSSDMVSRKPKPKNASHCPMTIAHMLPKDLALELAAAEAGDIPWTSYHTYLKLSSYIGPIPDCANCPDGAYSCYENEEPIENFDL